MTIVRKLRNVIVDFGGEEHAGWLPTGVSTPRATPVERVRMDLEIHQVDGGYLLTWDGHDEEHRGDTWHLTVEDAMAQARASFDVDPAEWETLDKQGLQ